jgi:hypothetical protein
MCWIHDDQANRILALGDEATGPERLMRTVDEDGAANAESGENPAIGAFWTRTGAVLEEYCKCGLEVRERQPALVFGFAGTHSIR